MPTVNIPGKVRLAAYLLGATLFIAITYMADKHWAGGAELKAVGAFCALLNLLAASKTDTSDGHLELTPAVGELVSTPVPVVIHHHGGSTAAAAEPVEPAPPVEDGLSLFDDDDPINQGFGG